MAETAFQYAKTYANLLGGEVSGDALAVDFLSDTIDLRLLGSGHTPGLGTHEVWSDVSADEVPATGGYTAGGQAIASKTITVTLANSWGTQWAAATAYVVGQVVRPTAGNGRLYRCIVAGTSAGSQPTWPTVSGQTVVDNTVTWAEIGASITVVSSAATTWSSSTISARYAVLVKNSGTGSTSPLLALIDFGEVKASQGGPFTFTPNALGYWNHSTP